MASESEPARAAASPRVLLVDDDPDLCRLLQAELTALGFRVDTKTTAGEAIELLQAEPIGALVTDLQMPGGSGADLCARVVAGWPDVPVIVMTGNKSVESAVSAMRAGAQDFITKPIAADALALRLERAMQAVALKQELRKLKTTLQAEHNRHGLLGKSSAMRAVQDLVARVALSDASVLITGESGTGKELVARALHQIGRRASGPFVAVNCAAMPEQLLESELFGHAKGAFTDAREARQGLLVQASLGTLLLDEVGEMPMPMQAKLLRALQERTVRPVGGSAEVKFDARLVTATNRDLESMVEEGTFRADLLYRLDVIHVELPPLRNRGGDVLLLAQHFLDGAAARAGSPVHGIGPEAAQRLLAYSWPGNARELQNCIERAIALARYDKLTPEDLPAKVRDYQPSGAVLAPADPAEVLPLAEVERRYILQTLGAFAGNKTLAAKALGVGRKTLYRKLEEYAKGTVARDEPA